MSETSTDTTRAEDEREMRAFQVMSANEGVLMQAHLAAVIKFASLALQGAFLLNTSVGVAAFSGTCPIWIVAISALGAMIAVLAAGAAYMTQCDYMKYDLIVYRNQMRMELSFFKNIPIKLSPIPTTWFSLTKKLFYASIFCFLAGLSIAIYTANIK